MLPAVREGAAKAGRDLADLDLLIEMKVSFDADAKRAMDDCILGRARAVAGREDRRRGPGRDAAPRRRAPRRACRQAGFLVSADPDEHVEGIKRYLDLGFTHLVFHAPGPDQERFLRLYGEHIIPRLKKLAG